MNVFRRTVLLPILAVTLTASLTAGSAFAQPGRRPGPHPYVRHDDWRKGGRIGANDWRRGAPVDYRQYHLSRPPRGYQWREVDGNYVLAAVATGLIASAIVASTIH